MWFIGVFVATVVALAGIAVATPRRYEAVLSPLVSKACIFVMLTALA